jgi:hypothetical protein
MLADAAAAREPGPARAGYAAGQALADDDALASALGGPDSASRK